MMRSFGVSTRRHAKAVLAVAMLLSLASVPQAAHARSGRSTLSTLPRRHDKGIELDDDNFSAQKGPSMPSSGHLGTGVGAPASSGYNPRQIRGFWSHFHGAQSRRKSKSLERKK